MTLDSGVTFLYAVRNKNTKEYYNGVYGLTYKNPDKARFYIKESSAKGFITQCKSRINRDDLEVVTFQLIEM